MQKFVHLRVLTHFSISQSIIKVKDLINFCKNQQIESVGICDKSNLFGAVEFSLNAFPLQPILGALVHFEHGYMPLLVKNEEGYFFLSKLLSDYYIRASPLSVEDLVSQKGLVCLTGTSDEVENKFFSGNYEEEELLQLKNIFGNDLYLEITEPSKQQKLLKSAIDLDISIVATFPIRFLKAEQFEAFYIFNSIESGKAFIKEEMEESIHKFSYFPSYEEVKNKFFWLREAMENTVRIAEKCRFALKKVPQVIPRYKIDEYFLKEELPNLNIPDLNLREGEFLPRQYEPIVLEQKARFSFKNKFVSLPEEKQKIYYARLEKELKVLIEKKFCGYFLITADFVNFAHRNNIPVGLGRGSGTGSLISYLLKITGIDPIKYDLIFERFLNPGRIALPDFDIDFCPERRAEVQSYLEKKYGHFSVLNIITFGTMLARRSILDVGKILGFSFKECSNLSRLIPQAQVDTVVLSQALELIPPLKTAAESPRYEKLFKNAILMEGLVRNCSKHACGLVLLEKPIYDCIGPLFTDNEKKDGVFTTQFDLIDVELVGAIKFDFLGLRTLTIIDTTCKLIKKQYNIDVEWNNLALDEKEVFKLLGEKNPQLHGIFQLEGLGMVIVIKKMKPDCFEDIIVLISLYRPGPASIIDLYIQRKKGLKSIVYFHEKLFDYITAEQKNRIIYCFEKTFGLFVFQEQVMEITQILAGYSLEEADNLRRAMGKKKIEEMDREREKFVKGAKNLNLPEDISNLIFDKMSEFAAYGFNRSHAAPYAYLSYCCAYLRALYPKEFLSICLTLECNDTEKVIKYIYTLRSAAIEVLLPDIKKSSFEFTTDKTSVRYGFCSIKGLGETTAKNILKICSDFEKVNKVSFNNSINDFSDIKSQNYSRELLGELSKHLNKKSWEALVCSGALDNFGFNRSLLYNSLSDLQKGEFNSSKNVEKLSKLEMEKKAFGFYINSPCKLIRNTIKTMGAISIASLLENSTKRAFIAGEIVLFILKKAKGAYGTITIVDERSMLELAVNPDLLQNKEFLFKEGQLVVIEASLDTNKNSQGRATCKNIQSLEEFLLQPHAITIKIKSKKNLLLIIDLIKQQEEGFSEVFFIVEDELQKTHYKIRDSINFRENLQDLLY